MTMAWGGGTMARVREPGLEAAFKAADGMRSLARKVSVGFSSVQGWRRVPRARVFDVAAATGLEPEVLRPDLADWIAAERHAKWFERARSRFAVSSGLGDGSATVRSHERPDPRTLDLLDLGLIAAALRFAAEDRGLTGRAVWGAPTGGAGGAPTPEQSARSLGMALAVVVGRVNSETVAGVVGVTRQAVDNATERYLRARDGDDPETVEDGRVMERGRPRAAKTACPLVWAAERRFVKRLAGEGV